MIVVKQEGAEGLLEAGARQQVGEGAELGHFLNPARAGPAEGVPDPKDLAKVRGLWHIEVAHPLNWVAEVSADHFPVTPSLVQLVADCLPDLDELVSGEEEALVPNPQSLFEELCWGEGVGQGVPRNIVLKYPLWAQNTPFQDSRQASFDEAVKVAAVFRPRKSALTADPDHTWRQLLLLLLLLVPLLPLWLLIALGSSGCWCSWATSPWSRPSPPKRLRTSWFTLMAPGVKARR